MNPAPFKAHGEQDAGVFVIAVEGELDMNTAAQLERELQAPLAGPDSSLVIDLSECEFIDSTGIALIVKAWQQLDSGFALCGIGDQVARVLEITGLEQAVPIHAGRAEAIAGVRR